MYEEPGPGISLKHVFVFFFFNGEGLSSDSSPGAALMNWGGPGGGVGGESSIPEKSSDITKNDVGSPGSWSHALPGIRRSRGTWW